ncbi:hypothetical protein I203_107180 [Kwoniella mangroviensis CBS 8507]|uniref:hypothetical protein n=1 Tax=Kwoniella mangroviensis CBS 8507 TaxID=1296122 RepID=UPI00305667DA
MPQSSYPSDQSVEDLLSSWEPGTKLDLSLRNSYNPKGAESSNWFDQSDGQQRSWSPTPECYDRSSTPGSQAPSLSSSNYSSSDRSPPTPVVFPVIPEDESLPSDAFSSSQNGASSYHDQPSAQFVSEDRYTRSPSPLQIRPPADSGGQENSKPSQRRPNKTAQLQDWDFQWSRPRSTSEPRSDSAHSRASESDYGGSPISTSPFPSFHDRGPSPSVSDFSDFSGAWSSSSERSTPAPSLPAGGRNSSSYTGLQRGTVTHGRGYRSSSSVASSGASSFSSGQSQGSESAKIRPTLDPNSAYSRLILERESRPDDTASGVSEGRVLPSLSAWAKQQAKQKGSTNRGYHRGLDGVKSRFQSSTPGLTTIERTDPETEAFWSSMEQHTAEQTQALKESRANRSIASKISWIASQVRSVVKRFSHDYNSYVGRKDKGEIATASNGESGKSNKKRNWFANRKCNKVKSNSSNSTSQSSSTSTVFSPVSPRYEESPRNPSRNSSIRSSSSTCTVSRNASSTQSRISTSRSPTLLQDDNWLGDGGLGIDVDQLGRE